MFTLILILFTGIVAFSVNAQSMPPLPREQFNLPIPGISVKAPFSSPPAIRTRYGIGGRIIAPEVPGIICPSGRGPMAVARLDVNYNLEGDVEVRPKLYPLAIEPMPPESRPGQHLLSSYTVFDGLRICMIGQVIPVPVLPIKKPYGIQ